MLNAILINGQFGKYDWESYVGLGRGKLDGMERLGDGSERDEAGESEGKEITENKY